MQSKIQRQCGLLNAVKNTAAVLLTELAFLTRFRITRAETDGSTGRRRMPGPIIVLAEEIFFGSIDGGDMGIGCCQELRE